MKNFQGLKVSKFLGFLVSSLLRFFFSLFLRLLIFRLRCVVASSFRSFFVASFLGFFFSWFRAFFISCVFVSVIQKSFHAASKDFDPILPMSHFILFDRCWSHILASRDFMRGIFGTCRCPSFPNSTMDFQIVEIHEKNMFWKWSGDFLDLF